MRRKGKIFYQDELPWLLVSLFFAFAILFLQLGPFVALIVFWLKAPSAVDGKTSLIVLSVITFLLMFFFYPQMITRFSWNIHMDEEKMWMKGDYRMKKEWRIQKPTEVLFSEIKSIHLEYSKKNSSGHFVRNRYEWLWTEKRFLVIETVHKKIKRFHVSHFTDPKLFEIVGEIVKKAMKTNADYDGREAAEIFLLQNNK